MNFVVAETIQYTIINEYTAYHVRMERENDIVELVQSSSSLTISDSRISNLSGRRLIASESASCSSKDKGCKSSSIGAWVGYVDEFKAYININTPTIQIAVEGHNLLDTFYDALTVAAV